MQVTPELIRKYHLGQCAPEEESAVLQWLAGETSDNVPSYLPENERAAAQSRIWDGLEDLRGQESDSIKAVSRPMFWKWSRIAASVLIVSTLSWLGYNNFVANEELPKIATIHYQEIYTAPGEKKKLCLPDSSLVVLNAGSHLRFPDRFTDTSRTVYLSGEAFFEINKDPLRPFTVKTSETETRVLGTIFNLKAYADEETSLAVVEGKVRFGSKDKQVVLTANQYASFNATSHTLASRNVYAAAHTGWKENKLVFRDSPLSDIAVVLERWYGIHVEIRKQALRQVIFTGNYENPSLQTILNDMSSVMKFTYKQEGKQLIIQ